MTLPNMSNFTIESVDYKSIPEVSLSKSIREKLKNLELYSLSIGEFESIAEISKKNDESSFVFFPNTWFYIAVLCKQYSLALFEYFNLFEKIRSNGVIIDNFIKGELDQIDKNVVPEEDLEAMSDFINHKGAFAEKNIVNEGKKIRPSNDVFSSYILSKLPIQNASSSFLGYIIYSLCKHEDIYNELEKELRSITQPETDILLPSSTVRDRAKKIIEIVYKDDQFRRLSKLMKIKDANIGIDTSEFSKYNNSNLLSSVFITNKSAWYNSPNRTFTDLTYTMELEGQNTELRCTTQWQGEDAKTIDDKGKPKSGNFIAPLVDIINKYYSDSFCIIKKDEKWYISTKLDFSLDILPKYFQSNFAKRYITSLLAKPFVIITGNSGTGKTNISKKFAQYLEVKFENGENNWLLVPVGADWTDNTKLLGFYNPLANDGKGKYVKTQILSLIERANSHPTVPFFLILDEMNLSHVERYFADFLSHMETPEIPFHIDGYDGILAFPSNLFITGTVNIDETTYMFSPKVLDRANVIEFKPEKENIINSIMEKETKSESVLPNSKLPPAFMQLSSDIRKKSKISSEDSLKKVADILVNLYDVLEPNGFEFAYRTVKEIKQYVIASLELGRTKQDLNNVEDEQIIQKILPKLHGNRKELRDCLTNLQSICENHDFKLCSSKLKQMLNKLDKVQYASFI